MEEKLAFDFGVEELAVAIGMLKKTKEANGLLLSTLGKISTEEEKGRLSAAYNSLFARGLLTYDQGEAILPPGIKELLDIFFESKKLVKVGKTVDTGEDVVSYYAHEGNWMEHSVTQGVAHRFRYPVREKTMLKNIGEFFSPHSLPVVAPISIDIPADLIMDAPPGTLSNYDTVLAKIGKNKPHVSSTVKQLSDDIANGLWRASTVWMNRPDKDQLQTRGYLWVQGKERLWSINSKEPNLLQASLCSEEDFNIKLQELISTK